MATYDRDKLVGLLVAMLEKRGPAMVAELERRVAGGQPLEVRGIHLDVSMQEEALKRFKSTQERSRSRTPPRSDSKSVDSPPSSPRSASDPKSQPKLTKAASPKKTGTRWMPSGSSAGGARWKPGAPSATLLAAKATMECEAAEAYSRSVKVIGDEQIKVLLRPDMNSELTGTHLSKGQIVEVVARFVCQRDGRVYVRLRMQEGWVSTRSRDTWSKAVLGPVEGESPIEPARCNTPILSTAMRMLPEVAPEAISLPEVAAGASEAATDEAAEDDDAGEEQGADEEAGADDEAGDAEEAEEEEGEHAEGDEDAAHDEEVEGEEMDAEEDEEEVEGGGDPTKKKTKKFRVVIGRCPILSAPNFKELQDRARSSEAVLMKEEVIVDGYTFVPAEQRVYLRLTRHRGWICERSRTDIWRFAVLPVTYRRKPLSKKAAFRVAFHGGDASEHTKLRATDLVKNSYGKIVSKKASEAAKKRIAAGVGIGKWTQAVKQAREELNLSGFVAVKKGSPVYERAQEIYKKMKEEEKSKK